MLGFISNKLFWNIFLFYISIGYTRPRQKGTEGFTLSFLINSEISNRKKIKLLKQWLLHPLYLLSGFSNNSMMQLNHLKLKLQLRKIV